MLAIQKKLTNIFYVILSLAATARDFALSIQIAALSWISNTSFLILNAVGFILPALVLESLTEKIGRVKTHITSVAIMSFGYLLIVLLDTAPIYLYEFMAICGIGWAAIVSLSFAIISEKVDK